MADELTMPTCCEVGAQYTPVIARDPQDGLDRRQWTWRGFAQEGARFCPGCGAPLPGTVDGRLKPLRERLEQMANRDRNHTGLWWDGARWSAREIIKLIDHLEGKPNG